MIVLASTMALARWEEFELHVRAALLDQSSDGLSPDELKEVLMQAAIYSGVPAANTGFALAQQIIKELAAQIGYTIEAASVPAALHPGVGREGVTASLPALHYSVRAPRSGKAGRRAAARPRAIPSSSPMRSAAI